MSQYRLGEGPYGSAYRGTLDDVLAAGDLSPAELGSRTFGLYLGQFDWRHNLRHVWEVPQRGLLGFLNDRRLQDSYTETVNQVHDFRFTGDQHHLLVAGTGAGKFRDVLSNMLLYDGSCETSCLIIDPKGEIASTMGPILDGLDADDPRTLILDPWNVCNTGFTHALTLLEGLDAESPHCVKDARVLADAIIVHREGDGGHWDQTAKNFLTALLLYLATDPIEVDRRHLRRLREIVTLPWGTADDPKDRATLGRLLEYLAGNQMFGGIVARAVQAFLNREPKERSYILSTIERDTEFVEDPALWSAIDHTTVDINSLVRSNKRLHVIVPFDYIKPMRSWLRLTIAAYYNACLRNQMNPALPRYLQYRHIIIDEFPSLGELDFMVRDIAEARGAGIKYHLTVQSFAQLKGLYGDQWETFVSNCLVHAFGIDDIFTSEYLSKLTGQATVVTKTEGFTQSTTITRGNTHGTGTSRPRPFGWGSDSTSSSETDSFSTTRGTSTTFSTTGRPVLMPDEVRRLSKNQQLLFLRGMPVLLSRRAPYFEIFQKFLPKHSLSDALSKQKQRLLTARSGSDGKGNRLVVFNASSEESFVKGSDRLSVNSRLRGGTFNAPLFKPQTLREALIASAIPLSLVALAFLAAIYFAGSSYLSHLAEVRANAAHRTAVIASVAPGIASAAQRALQAPGLSDASIAGLINEVVRGTNDSGGAVNNAMAGVSSTLETLSRAAQNTIPPVVKKNAPAEFDDTALAMIVDAGRKAVEESKRRSLEGIRSNVESAYRKALLDAARQAFAEARSQIDAAAQQAVEGAKQRAIDDASRALDGIDSKALDKAAQEKIESAAREMEVVRRQAMEDTARRLLEQARPRFENATRKAAEDTARKAAEDVARGVDSPQFDSMLTSAESAIQEMMRRPIGNAMERDASPAFLKKRDELSQNDRQRYFMYPVAQGITAAFIRASPEIAFLFEVKDKVYSGGERCPLASLVNGGREFKIGGQRTGQLCQAWIMQYDALDWRNEVTLAIAGYPPVKLPESVRRTIYDWLAARQPRLAAEKPWPGGLAQPQQTVTSPSSNGGTRSLPRSLQCGFSLTKGFSCESH